MTKIESLPTGAKFSYNDKIYVILLREGNMSEVKDELGKRWAWPVSAKVITIQPFTERQYFH
jgi:hypothetical protein